MSALKNLCRANQGVLQQKLGLMEVLQIKHGRERAYQLYQTVCPIVKATIGQHLRHSMDHIERAVYASKNDEIHYDLRERDTPEEHDWDRMKERIQAVNHELQNQSTDVEGSGANLDPVNAYFMLSGDSDQEFSIPSYRGRELAFAAHHAIHHLALVRIIATCSAVGELDEADLPPDFGRAPSTVNFDRIRSK